MPDSAKRFDVHRISILDLIQDPAKYGFEFDEDLDLVRVFPPCIGCGHCCLAAPCAEGAAAMAFKGQLKAPRCAYLYWGGDRYWCGLHGNAYVAKQLAHGEGCCQPLNSFRKDVRFRG